MQKIAFLLTLLTVGNLIYSAAPQEHPFLNRSCAIETEQITSEYIKELHSKALIQMNKAQNDLFKNPSALQETFAIYHEGYAKAIGNPDFTELKRQVTNFSELFYLMYEFNAENLTEWIAQCTDDRSSQLLLTSMFCQHECNRRASNNNKQ